MKLRNIFTLFILTMAVCPLPAAAIVKDAKIEQQIEHTLQRMTLEEKIGQMTEISIDVLGHWEKGEFILDPATLHQVFDEYKVGSILNSPGPVAQTPEKWRQIIGTIQKYSLKSMGIPCIYGLDQNHGTTYTLGGILFPQNINMAASFSPALVQQAAQITAYETRAADCPWTYSPTVDLSRDPRWPRVWENYGEDCLVNAVMGSAAVRGFQGEDPGQVDAYHIAACMKHYMGYSVPRTGKDRTPAYISDADMREKFFAPFKAGVEAGALSVMVNSASVNGVPMHINHKYLTEWLKDELQWDGMIVTDWGDINNLYTRECVAKDKKDAIRQSINAGIDMVMEPYKLDFCTLLKELVQEGKVPMSRIDDAVRRVLRLKYRLGLFDHPNTELKNYPDFGSKQHEAVALQAAEESMILLKNEGDILPLKGNQRILVTGPNANSMRCLDGGWSYTWQGDRTDEFAGKYNTILEAMQQQFGKDRIMYAPGVTYKNGGKYWEENVPEIDQAVAAASQADVIVACIGENSYTETPGNLDDLNLSDNQQQLVKALAKTGKKLILVLNEGRPRLIPELEPLASAVVDMLIPGNMGADALVKLLTGEVNFSGRLPYTYPRHQSSLTTYDFRASEEVGTMSGSYDYNAQVSVQWPFGHGLSYTTYVYSNLRVNRQQFTADDQLQITIDVTNTGKVAGKESVLLYSSDLVASMTPEGRRLRAFDKIALQPQETKTVTFTIPAKSLAFVNNDGKWTLEEGDFRLTVGDQTQQITCTRTDCW
jgi:beta-glucosidase